MNICLIGNGISALLLANTLANRNIKVSIYGVGNVGIKLVIALAKKNCLVCNRSFNWSSAPPFGKY